MLYQKGQAVYNEITDQPRLWRETLNRLAGSRQAVQDWFKAENFGQVVFLGCGSAHCVGLAAAKVTHRVSGLNAVALPSSEILYLNRPPYDPRIKTLLIPMSRKGDTVETLWAVEKLRKLNPTCKALGLAAGQGPLLGMCDKQFRLEGAEEYGPVATKSATTMLLTSMVLTCFLAQGRADAFLNELNRLPEMIDPKDIGGRVQKVGTSIKPQPHHVAFLGSGPYLGVAAEGSLKMREIVGIAGEYQNTVEYRHGSHCGLSNQTLVVTVLSDTLKHYEEETLQYLAHSRTPRFVLAEEASQNMRRCEYALELHSGVSELSRLLVSLIYIQLLCYYMAFAKGVNPDKPKLLEQTLVLKDKPNF